MTYQKLLSRYKKLAASNASNLLRLSAEASATLVTDLQRTAPLSYADLPEGSHISVPNPPTPTSRSRPRVHLPIPRQEVRSPHVQMKKEKTNTSAFAAPVLSKDACYTPDDVPSKVALHAPENIPSKVALHAPEDVPSNVALYAPEDVPSNAVLHAPEDVPSNVAFYTPEDVDLTVQPPELTVALLLLVIGYNLANQTLLPEQMPTDAPPSNSPSEYEYLSDSDEEGGICI
jgi:hypothetical protein